VDYDEFLEGESYYDADDRLIVPYRSMQRDLHVWLLSPVRVTAALIRREPQGMNEIRIDIVDQYELTLDDREFELRPE
jgi:hypothetical protein